jgi:hypothetical protein
MLASDFARLDAEVDRVDPSKLRIDIRLHSPTDGAGPQTYDAGDIRRAVREGFRDALADIQIERLIQFSAQPRAKTRRWPVRLLTFVVCVGLGSVATAILSRPVSHSVVGSLSLPPGDPAGLAYSPSPSVDAPDLGAQSSGAPTASSPQPAPPGLGVFGLHEQ